MTKYFWRLALLQHDTGYGCQTCPVNRSALQHPVLPILGGKCVKIRLVDSSYICTYYRESTTMVAEFASLMWKTLIG